MLKALTSAVSGQEETDVTLQLHYRIRQRLLACRPSRAEQGYSIVSVYLEPF